MNLKEIASLPDDPKALKAEMARMATIIGSYEEGKRARAKEAEIAAASPAASFEIAVFEVKAQLEGLQDGSEDYANPKVRGDICRAALKLVSDLFAALPKA
jgi:hypothetical protein